MIKLTITEKGGESRALSFDQNEVSIGRVQGNDIVLAKGNISKRHSKLALAEGKLMVSDLKSTNGTYVNGRKIGEPIGVRAGDKIFVGDFLIVVDNLGGGEASSSGSRPPPPPPPPRRPGARPAPHAEAEGASAGDLVDKLGSVGGGRPPAPPPPPAPKRTIVTTSLQDDRADIGDEPPPSPADISLDSGADAADLAGDAEGDMDGSPGAEPSDLVSEGGSDVFGSEPADDEDAALAGSFAAPPPVRAHTPPPGEGRVETAPPVSAAPPAPSRPMVAHAAIDGAAGMALEGLLGEAGVTTIFVSPGVALQVERAGRLEYSGAVPDGNAIAESVWQLANRAVPPPPPDNPVVDVRLLDGTRVTALFPPVAAESVCAVIRKPPSTEVPLAEIAASADVDKILNAALSSRRNLLLCGDAQAVAVLLAALGAACPTQHRVVSLGAGARARPGWLELGPSGDPAGLVRSAVAFRADHLACADAGGAELPELLLAAARGQPGVIACLAARSTAEALARLRAFTVEAFGPAAFSSLVTSTIDLVVLAASGPNGEVRVQEIAEPKADGDGLVPAYVAKRPAGSRAPTLEVAGVSERLASAIAAAADSLPSHLVRR